MNISDLLNKIKPGTQSNLIPSKAGRDVRNTLLHWKIIFSVFFITIIAISVHGYIIYDNVNDGDFFQLSNNVNPVVETKSIEQLKKALEEYRLKKTSFNNIKKEGSFSADPSK